MRHKERKRRSKLKLRPYGVITIQTGEPDKSAARSTVRSAVNSTVDQATTPRRTVKRAAGTATIGNKASVFLSLLKGLSIIWLLALVFIWTTNRPYSEGFLQNIKSDSSSVTNSTTNSTVQNATVQNATANPNATPGSDSQPADDTTVVDITDRKTTETKDEKAISAQAENSSAEAKAPDSLGADKTINDTRETLTTQDASPPAADNQPGTPEAPETLTPENSPTNSNGSFVKAYKASLFSSLATDATETPVAHGAEVMILDRMGDWVKVEMPNNGIVGFIHISHMNIQ